MSGLVSASLKSGLGFCKYFVKLVAKVWNRENTISVDIDENHCLSQNKQTSLVIYVECINVRSFALTKG